MKRGGSPFFCWTEIWCGQIKREGLECTAGSFSKACETELAPLGKMVFATDDVEAGWDGADSSSGVYYWLLAYEGLNGKTGKVKGWVMLL